MRSMWWQLGILGTISDFAYRHRETKKNLCRDVVLLHKVYHPFPSNIIITRI